MRTRREILVGASAVGGFAALGGMGRRAQAQAADLVIDGETIASGATLAAARQDGTPYMYAGLTDEQMKQILALFTQETGIKVTTLRLSTLAMYQRATTEFDAHKLEADYVDMSDATLVLDLVKRGILGKPHKVPGFDRIPAELKEPNGVWYNVIRPVSVLGVNVGVTGDANLPVSWNDMLDPRWQGKIGYTVIDSGGSSFTQFAFLKEVMGNDFWAKLAAQKLRFYPSSAPLAADFARGDVPLVCTSTDLIASLAKSGAPVKVIIPKEGIPSFPLVGGMTTVGKHPVAMGLLLDWLASKHAGTFIGKTALAYGLNPDSEPPVGDGFTMPPQSKVWNLGLQHWTDIRDSYTKEWHQVFGQT